MLLRERGENAHHPRRDCSGSTVSASARHDGPPPSLRDSTRARTPATPRPARCHGPATGLGWGTSCPASGPASPRRMRSSRSRARPSAPSAEVPRPDPPVPAAPSVSGGRLRSDSEPAQRVSRLGIARRLCAPQPADAARSWSSRYTVETGKWVWWARVDRLGFAAGGQRQQHRRGLAADRQPRFSRIARHFLFSSRLCGTATQPDTVKAPRKRSSATPGSPEAQPSSPTTPS